MTACFNMMKALQPRQRTDASFCTPCVYYSMNLDHSMYNDKGIGNLPENGCSLDFLPKSEQCGEMRTSNCSVRKAR